MRLKDCLTDDSQWDFILRHSVARASPDGLNPVRSKAVGGFIDFFHEKSEKVMVVLLSCAVVVVSSSYVCSVEIQGQPS